MCMLDLNHAESILILAGYLLDVQEHACVLELNTVCILGPNLSVYVYSLQRYTKRD